MGRQKFKMTESIVPALHGVGNHESKAVLLAGMAQNPARWHAALDLQNILMGAQKDAPDVVEYGLGAGVQLCHKTMLYSGCVDEARIISERGREATGYRVSEYGLSIGRAVAGVALAWSIEHSQISIQQLLGKSSKSHIANDRHERYEILKALISLGGEASFKELAAVLPEGASRAKLADRIHEVRGYESDPLLEITSKQQGYNPSIQILNPAYRGDMPFERLLPEVKSLYGALGAFAKESVDVVGVAAVCHRAVKEYAGEDDVNISLVKKRLLNWARLESVVGPAPKSSEDSRPNLDDRDTCVVLTEKHRSAIESFVCALTEIESGAYERGNEQVAEVLTNSGDCASILRKGRNFSPTHQASLRRLPTDRQIIQILQDNSRPCTPREITNSLNSAGVSIRDGSVRDILNQLEGIGRLRKAELEPDASRRNTKRGGYVINPDREC